MGEISPLPIVKLVLVSLIIVVTRKISDVVISFDTHFYVRVTTQVLKRGVDVLLIMVLFAVWCFPL